MLKRDSNLSPFDTNVVFDLNTDEFFDSEEWGLKISSRIRFINGVLSSDALLILGEFLKISPINIHPPMSEASREVNIFMIHKTYPVMVSVFCDYFVIFVQSI